MVNPCRKNDQVIRLQEDAHPLVALVTDIEVSMTIPDVPNFLVLMQVLVEKALDLLLVDIPHLLGRNGDLVTVLVPALFGQLVDVLNVAEVVV